METNCPDFQALTVFPKDETMESRFTIINVYDSSENSSYKAKLNAREDKSERPLSTLDQLLEFMANQENLGDIMLLGDLNARIGLNSPTFEDEDTETQPEYTLVVQFVAESRFANCGFANLFFDLDELQFS